VIDIPVAQADGDVTDPGDPQAAAPCQL
jgi:hypothetical protein